MNDEKCDKKYDLRLFFGLAFSQVFVLISTTTVSNSKLRILSNSKIRKNYILDIVFGVEFNFDITNFDLSLLRFPHMTRSRYFLSN